MARNLYVTREVRELLDSDDLVDAIIADPDLHDALCSVCGGVGSVDDEPWAVVARPYYFGLAPRIVLAHQECALGLNDAV